MAPSLEHQPPQQEPVEKPVSQVAPITTNLETISLADAVRMGDNLQAAHGLLWFKDNMSGTRFGLMQVRFDGLLGFPGGLVDEKINSPKEIVDALNREFEEEVNACDVGFSAEDHVISHAVYKYKNYEECDAILGNSNEHKPDIILNFFAKEVTKEQFKAIESNHTKACHFPFESLGIFRVPLGGGPTDPSKSSIRFLKRFFAQKFAGTARDQLISAMKLINSLSPQDIETLKELYTDIQI